MTLRVEWVTEESRWRELAPGWDELVAQSAEASIFATWTFLDACWTQFARPLGDRLAVAALFDGDRLVGAAPLRMSRRRRFGFPIRRLAQLGGWESDRAPFLFSAGRDAEAIEALRASLEAQENAWDVLELREVDPESAAAGEILSWASARRGHQVALEPMPPSPYVDLSEGWEAARARFGRSLRKNLRRHLNELGDPSRWSFDVVEGAGIGSALEEYLVLEDRSWKGKASQGVGKNERNVLFYRHLLPRLAEKGRACVSFLRLGGRPLSGAIQWRFGPTATGAQVTYDATDARFSPGTVLKSLCIERAAREGLTTFELQARFLESKRRWTPLVHANACLTVVQLRTLRHKLVFPGTWLRSLSLRRRAAPRPAGAER